jgi:hypothetical protein
MPWTAVWRQCAFVKHHCHSHRVSNCNCQFPTTEPGSHSGQKKGFQSLGAMCWYALKRFCWLLHTGNTLVESTLFPQFQWNDVEPTWNRQWIDICAQWILVSNTSALKVSPIKPRVFYQVTVISTLHSISCWSVHNWEIWTKWPCELEMDPNVQNGYLEEKEGGSCFFNFSQWKGWVFLFLYNIGEGHVICIWGRFKFSQCF